MSKFGNQFYIDYIINLSSYLENKTNPENNRYSMVMEIIEIIKSMALKNQYDECDSKIATVIISSLLKFLSIDTHKAASDS